MTIESDIRTLKHQITMLNAAMHCVCAVLTEDQKRQALDLFDPLTQFAQAKLEASTSGDEELNFLIELRETLRKALLRPSQNT